MIYQKSAHTQGSTVNAGFNHYTIQVGSEGDGTHDTFIPVYWWPPNSSWGHRSVIISRFYAETGPSVHGTHKAGLLLHMISGNGDWGGSSHSVSLLHHSYQYRQTVAAVGTTAHNMKSYVLLRGGGYIYHFTVFGSTIDITVGHTGTNETYTNPNGNTYLDSTTTATLGIKGYA